MDAVQKALRVAKEAGGASTGTGAAPNTGAAPDLSSFVTGLYQSELGRAPEAAGLQGWLDALQSGKMTQDQVRQGILSSSENQVQDLYQGLLNRQIDPTGYGWVTALESGAMTPEQIRAGIMGSEEYKKLYPSSSRAGSGSETGTTPVDITKQGMPLVYTPPPYKDYGATSAAFRVASGLENLPAPFATMSPVSGGTPTGGGTTGGGTTGKTTYQDILNQLKTTPTTTATPTTTPATAAQSSRISDISKLYETYLGRKPEAGAAERWADAMASGKLTYNEVVNAIQKSPEYTQNQITQAYQKYLGRNPEETGLKGWAGAVASGKMSLNDVINSIKTSQEAQGLGAAAPSGGGGGAASSAVTAAYREYLGRDPEPGAAEAWQGMIASGKMTPDQVVAAIASSTEAQSRYPSITNYGFKDGGAVHEYAEGGGTSYEDLINAAYQDFLGRAPDDEGFKNWLAALTSGKIKPADFESKFKGAGYEDDIFSAYQKTLNRSPTLEEAGNWNKAILSGDLTLDQVMQRIKNSPEAVTQSTYQNVPTPDKFSELQGGRMYDIDIGRIERIPELGRIAAPVNVKQAWENSEIERLKRELEAAKAAGTTQSRDTGGGGNNGGEGGSNFGASDPSGTAGAIGVDAAGGEAGPGAPGSAGNPGNSGDGERYGGRINAVDNALRMIKADRR